MPLNQLVHMVQSIARHSAPSAADDLHPLHAGLDDILHTGKWCSYKYQEQLLNANICAPCTNLEASIMLFVLEHHALCGEQSRGSLDDKKRWLSEIEKRE
jgi:hypothetical protein